MCCRPPRTLRRGTQVTVVVLAPAGSESRLREGRRGVVELGTRASTRSAPGDQDPAPVTVASNVDLNEVRHDAVDPQEVVAGATGKAGGAAAAGANATVHK